MKEFKDLGKWQIISFGSRVLGMIPGWVQGFIYIGILSKTEWGVVKQAVSIGAAVGIFQHLGLASASTREISQAKNDDEVFKLFVTSTLIRYLVNLPVALFLFFGADFLAITVYSNAGLALPFKLYALVMVAQGAQSILNSVIQGTKHFKNLFIYQSVISYVSLIVFIPFVIWLRVPGYFIGMFAFNVISTLVLIYIAFKPLKFKVSLPSAKEFKVMFAELFSISMAIYLVKIIYTNWEGLGNNLVGIYTKPELLASFSFALLYSKKLMHISDSATDVSLPVFSEQFALNLDKFKSEFTKNFNRLFVVIVTTGVVAAFWVREISYIIIGIFVTFLTGINRFSEYSDSFGLVVPLVFAFVMYSFINLTKSGMMVPAKMIKQLIATFVILVAASVGFFYLFFENILGISNVIKFSSPLSMMAWGMSFGAIVACAYMFFVVNRKLKHAIFSIDHLAILFQGFFIAYTGKIDDFWLKTSVFTVLGSMLIWSFFIAGYVTKADVEHLKTSIFAKLKAKKHEKIS